MLTFLKLSCLQSGLGHSDISVMHVLKWLLALKSTQDASDLSLRTESGQQRGSGNTGMQLAVPEEAGSLPPSGGVAAAGSGGASTPGNDTGGNTRAPPLLLGGRGEKGMGPLGTDRGDELVRMVQTLTEMVAVSVI
jgi:hypothetical protein